MAFLGDQSSVDLANFKFSRRELPGKLFAIGAGLLLLKPQPEVPVTPTKVQPKPPEVPVTPKPEVPITSTELQPKFKIGDLIAQDWVGEFGENFADFGEILGARFLPVGNSCYPASIWLYYVRWTHSTCNLDSLYPCYDGEATRECDLRLVKQS
jgi:hypothetical protein